MKSFLKISKSVYCTMSPTKQKSPFGVAFFVWHWSENENQRGADSTTSERRTWGRRSAKPMSACATKRKRSQFSHSDPKYFTGVCRFFYIFSYAIMPEMTLMCEKEIEVIKNASQDDIMAYLHEHLTQSVKELIIMGASKEQIIACLQEAKA